MTTPRGTIIALFCDSQFEVRVLENGLRVAKERGAKIVFLDVRHRALAGKLQQMLASQGLLGRGVVDKLNRNVIDHRGEIIRRMLAEMKLRAEGDGLVAEVREERGEFDETVARVVRDTGATAIVIQADHHRSLTGPFEIVRV